MKLLINILSYLVNEHRYLLFFIIHITQRIYCLCSNFSIKYAGYTENQSCDHFTPTSIRVNYVNQERISIYLPTVNKNSKAYHSLPWSSTAVHVICLSSFKKSDVGREI